MQSLRRYRALPADDRALVREAAIVLTLVRLGISTLRFSTLRDVLDRWIRVFPRTGGDSTVHDMRRVPWSVAAVTRRLPFRSTCLVESLAVDAMLRRRGIASEIRFGVRPPGGGALSAHAWVEHDGAIVFGARTDIAEYSVLSAPAD